MENIKKSFNDYEAIIFKVALGILIYSVILFGMLILLVRINEDLARYLQLFIGVGIFASIITFLIAAIRIIRYLVVIKENDKDAKISKSVYTLFISTLSFAISFLTLIIAAIATAW